MSEHPAAKKLTTGKGKGKAAAHPDPEPPAPASTEKTASPANKPGYRSDYGDALLCVAGIDSPYIGGSYTGAVTKKPRIVLADGLGSDVKVQVINIRRQDATSFDGFTLEFAIGTANESTRFRVIYEPDMRHADSGRVAVAQAYKTHTPDSLVAGRRGWQWL
ncbi:hypothetical protein NKR19_g4171 [Coniochaeta hoffmannii]|uniref:Uncharacterized protein n=1 Tax=Coniochaeta hoffmannii TaxID=91930 RepID=A0AA38SBT5_9PEZI|nr:hypothetical protein NKR19_g4171 [Coniochaeta hoffmannii]